MVTADEGHLSMTATQTRPIDAEADPTAPSGAAPAIRGGGTEATVAPITGLAGLLGSSDHKVIGRLYIGTAMLLGSASVVASALVGIDLVDQTLGDTILDGQTADQVVSFAGSSAVLLFALPALLGLAMVVVPLQVGARSIAFPRAAAASYWAFLVGAGLIATAYAVNGGPGGGRSDAVDLWVAATGLVVAALVLGSICVATTVLGARTRGMSVERVPMFTWSMLCASVVWLLTLPVLGALLIIIYLDHRYGQIFLGGGGPAMYGRVSWIGEQPQVYAIATPVLGLLLDAAATAGGARLARRGAAQVAIAAFAVLGIGAFAIAAIAPSAADQPVTKGMALLAPLPVLAVLGLAGVTVRDGTPKPTSGLVGAVLATLLLLLGTVLGAATAFEGALELAGTRWPTAVSHLTLAAAALGLIAGLYHWATKVLGRAGNEALGRTAPLLVALGAVIVGGAEAVSGLAGDGLDARAGIEAMNGIAVFGAVMVVLGGVAAAVGLVGRRRAYEPSDPWGRGQTLEWATASPPSFANFDGDTPAVTSADPLRATSEDDTEGATS